MSTAALVPETRDLTGDDARATLRRIGKGQLFKDAFQRLRVADGFSHARSLAFMISLVAVQGVIALVGLASVLNNDGMRTVIATTIQRAVPGPAGSVLTQAFDQANATAAQHHYGPLLIGMVGGLFTATTAMGQLERGLNRLYGVEMDRPTVQKYGLAAVFAVSAGSLAALAFGCLAFGRDVLGKSGQHLSLAWAIVRWPLGLALIATAVTVLFRYSPRRKQPRLSWLAVGSGTSVVLFALATVGLGLFYQHSKSFGQTYGPIAGVIALLLWSLFSAIALFYGAAVAAQLEAARTGDAEPQDATKVHDSEPDATPARPAAPAGV